MFKRKKIALSLLYEGDDNFGCEAVYYSNPDTFCINGEFLYPEECEEAIGNATGYPVRCDYEDGKLTIIFKAVGVGTEKMAEAKVGEAFPVLTGLGNGYNTGKSGDKPLLIGGGVGVPPMYALCKKLISEGKDVTVILGFNNKDEIFYENEFKELGATVYITTVDGSYGTKGFVTDVMKTLTYSYFFTCGPMPMFKAIEATAVTSGQFSFEERMGCGFGACMGCSCETKYGNKRICRDGPVLEREEIIW
jgi:dihydroorotate dehydrogenase electron transfer subunit